ncbi:DNA polymerase III subunit delta [candidate division WOR-1 bacterium RIFOXYD2_FULL_36_8]|uniref:DNA polymerase III subunit delta n=1 Tax=candidate division WOR-1 bacterium RIFOXYB2_FULL_36_35 TaxID=1802578 RepID=A0A1F4S212_UNCSA|nr:MAG: DNA polymerase III subunit delta [candidate division WOR-1 bacterium RIFOXYA2_FULL_36_21]OGC14450.1 MAG: DNA polymerase III subunit delta [candidate division WOR-1 bacterium RIFOXYB2_FULL_36_35]OGC18538.1 MAG: DNA polymerase III subunit delta [candidate division WOR-1 bacterium RIFOXYA12_FULL_36_13]OGC37521.1 MAG: DNA polymerase III subunit delta [candidate division WOR-1 bacterium RIFOXYD2_FULL_36_8]
MIYLIYGDEQFLVQEEYKSILDKNPDASVEKPQDVSDKQLVELIFMHSLFSPKRIIVLDGFDFENATDLLATSFSNIPEGVIVVIKNPVALDKRSKIYKIINAHGKTYEFKNIPEWEEEKVVDFVKRTFLRSGKSISNDDAYFLVEGVGRNLSLLNSEIDKISTYVGEKELIEKSDIETLMIRSGLDLFTLLNSMFEKNALIAFRAIKSLLKEKENPLSILAFLASQYRLLLKVKLLSSLGRDPSQIARELKSSPYYIKRLCDRSRIFNVNLLKEALLMMYDADLKMKSGYDSEIELSLLISNLVG